jgi:hypothetical protein
MQPRYQRLVETVRKRTGAALRGVVAYQGEETALLYRRDDLDSRATHRIKDALETVKQRDPLVAAGNGDQRHASVELYGDAVFVHLPEGDDRGVLVSLDLEVARKLSGFVEECAVALRSPENGPAPESVSADG